MTTTQTSTIPTGGLKKVNKGKKIAHLKGIQTKSLNVKKGSAEKSSAFD
jgi:hypothetical protein